MTNERAVEILNLDLDILGQYGCETAEAYKMAIKALDAQPCEDCISRKAVIILIDEASEMHPYKVVGDSDTYSNYNQGWSDACDWLYANIEGVPSVTPRRDLAETSQDCISREEVQDLISRWLSDYLLDETREALETINYKVGDMPSVTPQRPKGKWIKTQSGDKDFPESIVCSRCKNENSHLDFDEHSEPIGKVFVTSKYCPNCGAEMGGADETN